MVNTICAGGQNREGGLGGLNYGFRTDAAYTGIELAQGTVRWRGSPDTTALNVTDQRQCHNRRLLRPLSWPAD